jgi:hypothetical protein
MTQVLDFSQLSDVGHKPQRDQRITRQDQEELDDFWPEVSRQASPDEAPVDPANTPKRVLFEMFLVLTAAIGSVAAVTFLVPSP